MGFKDDVRQRGLEFEVEINNLKDRVTQLENLAETIRQGDTHTARVVAQEVTTTTTTTATGEGIDFGAIAFGLLELRGKARSLNSSAVATIDGAAEFFADVFAKASPAGFNRAAFLRAARGNR